MAARPLPPPERDSTHKNTGTSETAEKSVKQPFLDVIRSATREPGLRKQLYQIMNKRWLRVAGIVIAMLVILLIALPFLINVNSFRPKIEAEASNALGRQVKLGDLSLSILSGGVSVQDISIADDRAFSKSPFVTAKSLKEVAAAENGYVAAERLADHLRRSGFIIMRARPTRPHSAG